MTVTELQSENTIPKGKYSFIGVDIDTTGRRILDEVTFFSTFIQFSLDFFFELLKFRLGWIPRAVGMHLTKPNENLQKRWWV